MQTYRLDPDDYPVRRRRILLQSSLLYALITIAVVAFLNRGGVTPSLAGIFGLLCPAIAGFLIGGLYTWASLRQLRARWFSYKLTLAEDWIRQRADRLPDVEFQRSDIVTIEEYPGTGLRLRTADKRNYVFIPAGLAEYSTVRNHVATWQPIEQKQSAAKLFLLCLVGGGLTLMLLATLIIVDSLLGVAVIAVLLFGGSLWGAVEIQRNRTLPSWFKIFIWIGFVLLLIIVAERVLTVM